MSRAIKKSLGYRFVNVYEFLPFQLPFPPKPVGHKIHVHSKSSIFCTVTGHCKKYFVILAA